MRLQLAMNVDNLEESIEFYEKMFNTPVLKVKPGYANFAIENPPLKLVLFEAPGEGGTLNHLGVEVETADQVEAAEQRITAAGVETSGIDDTLCCYAAKTETWVEGPDTKWEWYVKTADADQLDNTVLSADGTVCCAPDAIDAVSEAAPEPVSVSTNGSCC